MTTVYEPVSTEVLWFERTKAEEDRKAAAEERASDNQLDACERCGRGVRPEKAWWVEVVNGGSEIAPTGTNPEQDAGYMGFYVLGPECAKLVPITHRVRA